MAKCHVCALDFTPHHHRVKLCSPVCVVENRRRWAREWRANNPEKLKEYNAEAHTKHRARNLEYMFRYGLRRRYDMTVEQVEALIAKQGRACAICTTAFTSKLRPCVDHCHTTGAVRGLLCKKCNWGLGSYDDNPERLRTAAEYLEARRAR